MARARSQPASEDQRIRDLRKEFRGFEKEEPGADRSARLAAFARAAHDDRQLNMAMHAAQLCLADDPDDPALLVDAYRRVEEPVEDQLRSFGDLRDLGRYVDRSDVVEAADRELGALARSWVHTGDEQERRHRLRTLTSLAGRDFADRLRDELEFGA